MCLKVLERGEHRDVIIKEGEVREKFGGFSGEKFLETMSTSLDVSFTGICSSFTESL